MWKVCVIHNTLNSVGGGERVCLVLIEALKSLGYKVTLITTEPTYWNKVRDIVGNITRPDREVSLLPFRVKAFGIYLRMLTFLQLMKERKECDLTINTHGDVLPISSDIIYMHYPTFALLKENPVNIKYSSSLFWKMYFKPYEKIQSYFIRKMKWKILLTNSEFSREAIKKYVGTDAKVIYPPVEIDEFLKVSKNRKREQRIVSCGRYTPEKNYEFILKVAENLPHVEFIIIGASSGKISNTYYEKLKNIIVKRKMKNIRLLRNVSRKKQIEIYSRSKVFFHAMINEHFGIAIVEAMAAGLVPVVHKSGGPWYDIIDRGKYGYGFNNLEEAVEIIDNALKNYWLIREKVVRRAKMFSKRRFAKEIRKIIEELEKA